MTWTPVATFTPVATWTVKPTFTPIATWTAVPTYTPWPTITPTPTSTPTPDPSWRPPPPHTQVTGYGIQAHGEHRLDQVVIAVHDLGLGWVKQQVRWEQIEGTPGIYGWEGLDHIVDTYNRSGLKILLSVSTSPDWARTNPSGHGPPDDYGHFSAFMREMAMRYQGRVNAYEIWNEPNTRREWEGAPLNAADYVRLLRGAYQAIKAVDRDAIVVSAGLSPTPVDDGIESINDRAYLHTMYDAGLAYACDAIGSHPYGHANPPEVYFEGGNYDPARGWDDHPSYFFRNTMEDYYAIMVSHGDRYKRVWATEFGWPTVDGMSVPPSPGQEYAADIDEDQQAAYTVRAFNWAREWGHAGVMFLWSLNYWPAAGKHSEMAKYSIVRWNWAPRPAYEAVKAMEKADR
jgi:hypothetical protein